MNQKRVHLVEITEPLHKKVIPYAALAISAFTIAALVWQGLEARKHFRKSVVPQVNTYTTNLAQDENWGLFLQNQGLGPAKITLQRMTSCDDEDLKGGSPQVNHCRNEMTPDEVVERIGHHGFVYDTNHIIRREMKEEFFLEAGAKTPILVVSQRNIKKERLRDAMKFFRWLVNHKINLEYQWCSLYDECIDDCTALACVRTEGSFPRGSGGQIRPRTTGGIGVAL